MNLSFRLMLIALIICSWLSSAVAQRYTVTDLGTLPGDSESEARGISNVGQIVGTSSGQSGSRAFLWNTSTGMQSLGTLDGDADSQAFAVNDSGQVVGASRGREAMRAFVWSN